MSKTAIGRPEPTEYAEYYGGYIGKVRGSDILSFLERQLDSAVTLLSGIDEAKGDFRYEPGKWTIKELIGHIVDSERVFAYRAVAFARNDTTSLPGFDQEIWAKHANYGRLTLSTIVAEFQAVRRATIMLFQNLDETAWGRQGTGNNKQMTTRAAAYVIAGHAEHHLDILQSRYLSR